MSILSLANCLIGHHKPIRSNVHWKGKRLVGECRHCGAAIHRVDHGDWRAGHA
ncbi:hypothetical protein [Erythrobacter sp. THAF29]|uniref:hypothetical protein n=1 Tax=Erythrobacter sp. THAF29 TaxID=2587851 RepID=UPI0012A790F5|nr:hypothetical protein [Erythrobacter sp. THAF29]QFT76630.1 hypothetical protein FIU90_03635 [Erythrobacter sp. THAF29]